MLVRCWKTEDVGEELTRLIAVRLLDTASRRCGLASGLGGELLTGRFATGGLALSEVLVLDA